MHHPTDRITHTTAFVTPVVVYERRTALWSSLITWCNASQYLLFRAIVCVKAICETNLENRLVPALSEHTDPRLNTLSAARL